MHVNEYLLHYELLYSFFPCILYLYIWHPWYCHYKWNDV